MDIIIKFPTWEDVGVPTSIVKSITMMASGSLLDMLVLNRIFKKEPKPQHLCVCPLCDHSKLLNRVYEDYSSCEQCGGKLLFIRPRWRMWKDHCADFSSLDDWTCDIVEHIYGFFTSYFNQEPPENFFSMRWDSRGTFTVGFLGGQEVAGDNLNLISIKASLLCPFIWDDQFDWEHNVSKGIHGETHLLPLMNLWAEHKVKRKPRLGSSSIFPYDSTPSLMYQTEPIYTSNISLDDLIGGGRGMTNLLEEYRRRQQVKAVWPINDGVLFFNEGSLPGIICLTSAFSRGIDICDSCPSYQSALITELITFKEAPTYANIILHLHISPDMDLIEAINRSFPKSYRYEPYLAKGARDQEQWLWTFFMRTKPWTKLYNWNPEVLKWDWAEQAFWFANHASSVFQAFYGKIYSLAMINRNYILVD